MFYVCTIPALSVVSGGTAVAAVRTKGQALLFREGASRTADCSNMPCHSALGCKDQQQLGRFNIPELVRSIISTGIPHGSVRKFERRWGIYVFQ